MHPPITSTAHRPSNNAVCKRAFDVTVAGIALVLLAPLFVIAAAVIRLEGKGPVFLRQTRVGRFGKRFALLKFRTVNGQSDSAVGRWLRMTGIDELPQLLNVIIGDMSLVGPRPMIEHELKHLQPHHYERHEVLPGITGLAQVTCRGRANTHDMLKLDVDYVRSQSLLTDLKLIFATIRSS